MDTIQIKIQTGRELTIDDYNKIVIYINGLKSPYGYTYCDVIDLRGDSCIGVKISYPRYFYGSNVFLITKKLECFQVQKAFCDAIEIFFLTKESLITLERVDIPFTHIMDSDLDFNSYEKIFGVMALVHREKKVRGSRKMYSDIISQNVETLTYADTKIPSSYNNKVMIYNQYANIEAKTNEEDMLATYMCDYGDLKNRMRIEVSKKIRRNPFDILTFKGFDIVENYLDQLKVVALDTLLDMELIDRIYQSEANSLAIILNIERQKVGFGYEKFILQYISRIYDYEVIRRALGIAIDNIKTRENAVTAIRKSLNNYSEMNNIIVMDVYVKLWDIRNTIDNFKII